MSATLTPLAWDGPLFVTVMVYVRLFPAVTGSGLPVFVIDKSVEPLTVVVVVEELFPGYQSIRLPETDAVFVIDPRKVGLTNATSVTVAVAWSFRFPTRHDIWLVPEQVPWLVWQK